MPKFGEKSKKLLSTCHSDIQKVMNEAIKYTDFTIIEGARSLERQKELYSQGKSKIDGIKQKGKHNYNPSLAIDIAPYPIDWNDTKRFFFLAGTVLAIAKSMGIDMVWGGDWDADGDYADQTFNDYPHFQLGK
jgi:peptidoglycan L-alanyl-D-glutamate endopeptidase CwlK